MKRIGKRAELTTKEIIEIVLGGAATLLLIVLLYNLIAPNFDKDDETAKSYFDSFEDAVAVADSGEVGLFSMWMPNNTKKGKDFFLIYFGSNSIFGDSNKRYTSIGHHVNQICVCYWDSLDVCKYCKNLDHPSVLVGSPDDNWAISAGEEIEIIKGEEIYNVTRKV